MVSTITDPIHKGNIDLKLNILQPRGWLTAICIGLRSIQQSFKYAVNCFACGFAMRCESSERQRLFTVSSWQMAIRENKCIYTHAHIDTCIHTYVWLDLLISIKWKLKEVWMAGMLGSRASSYLCNFHYISFTLYIVKYHIYTHTSRNAHMYLK